MFETLVAYVMDHCDTIKGKKAFQKIFYFLTEQDIPTGLSYSLYHYGPYSSDLDYKTELVEQSGAISINKVGQRYNLTKGDKVDFLLKNDLIAPYKDKIDYILDILPLDNPLQLELLSTTHYAAMVQKEIYNNVNPDSVIQEVKNIKKTKFKEKEIYEAYNYLKQHRLLE
ncbi:hypothetical protein [Clostridium formicaceticum]|uniref:Antitoxin SocA-like Panacea domain-containing protein n=1 Tax=Clostridium formicaceticum TaxID=1497 RepID=A0AAC9WHK8_9CLOT|nr:hypothetical protein [Clostridium formicaceticum]AOY74705.1 hypothetical protein BJL90_01285 [Clostridium formicaceticum]ARE89083.1 hypothetical protein CLFO_34890 [Clostridium formicaceticum]